MTEFAKAKWSVDNDKISVSMPISKIDEERRIVTGFATLDNIDKQGDIVTVDASTKAFEKFKGNVREMHQAIAVGRVVSFKNDSYFDPETKEMYNGIVVSAYISKGAQATWEKVLDGTLSGFSIGGVMKEVEPAFNEKLDTTIRVIKDYELYELSLVDNPANQFANIISIQKSDDGSLQFDMLVKGKIENVFWCKPDGLVRLADSETSACPACDTKMDNIGFVESNDTDKTEAIKSIFKSFTDDSAVEAATEVAEHIAKEENIVAEETVVEVEKSDDVVVEDVVEKSDEATTPAAESGDAELTKAVEEVKTVATAVSELADLVKSIAGSLPELTKSVDSLKADVEAVKANVEEFGKRVDAVETDTAVRKSGDLGGIAQVEEKIEKSVWGGRFLKSADLYRS